MNHPKRSFGLMVAIGLTLVAGSLGAEGGHHWSYQGGTGPAKWAALEPEFSACELGELQSPIDIQDAIAKKSDLPPLVFDYKPSPLKIIDNGHTIQIDYAPGSSVTIEGKQYELAQFHFHKPSEEELNGKRADMVAHLVHKDRDGNLAVVAVLLESGQPNKLIQVLWKNLPKQKEKEVEVPGVKINAIALLPADRAAYYIFSGSLTTPPCSEGVTWVVLRTPTSISQGEVARFAHVYPMNARPIQPLNGREIRVSE